MVRTRLAAPTLFALVLAVYAMLGLADGATGTAWPSIRDAFNRTDSSFGLIFVALSGGYMVAGIASGHIADRIGTVTTIIVGVVVSTIGLGLLAVSATWWMVLAGFAGLGLGNGMGDASGNTWVALNFGPRHMGMLHAAYGVGASIGPVLMSVLIVVFDWWRGSFAIIGIIQLTVMVLLLRKRNYNTRHSAAEENEFLASRVAAPRRVTIELVTWFALYVGAEVAAGQWALTLLSEGRGYDHGLATALAAGYWIGMTAGRFGMAAFGNRIDPERLLWEVSLIAVVASAFLWSDPFGVGGFAIPVIGLAFSVMFPLAMGRTPHYLGSERTSRVVGYQFAGSSIGATTLPALIGVLADTHGVGVAPPVILATVVAMTVLWGVIRRETRVAQ
ncbi:MAG: MFS transporter [Actinobacteria bacterium]|nr:MFS transporter [Actinomycetota bacterium]